MVSHVCCHALIFLDSIDETTFDDLLVSLVLCGFCRKRPKKIKLGVKKTDKMQGSMATTTPLVRSIFDAMFQGQIDDADIKDNTARRRRCNNCDVSDGTSDACQILTASVLKDLVANACFSAVLSGERMWPVPSLS